MSRMNSIQEQSIREIHDSGVQMALAITGGGTSAISALLSVPGASRSVLEAIVPYHESALTDLLGRAAEQACSAATARSMAMAAFQRASRFSDKSEPDYLLGIGCTAALTTDRSRRGQNRCFIAVQSIRETREIAIELNKAERSRETEEALCAETIIAAIRVALALEPSVSPSLEPGETLDAEAVVAPEGWAELLTGRTRTSWYHPVTPGAIFPGAFSPVHQGHREMARIAAEMLGTEIALEISVFNVDKGPLDYIEMARRLQNVSDEFPLVLTNAPTFLEKARLFPATTFIVGSDTMERIVSPHYYNDSVRLRDEALGEIRDLGNRFLVFGRVKDGRFTALDDLELPHHVLDLCTAVPEERFRVDVSSTHLRSEQ